MGDYICAFKFRFCLGQDTRHIECDIAHADHDRMLAAQIGIEVRELGMAVIPSDECRASKDVGQILTFDAEFAIMRRAGSDHDCIVQSTQFGNRYILPNPHIADKAYILRERGLFVAFGHTLD